MLKTALIALSLIGLAGTAAAEPRPDFRQLPKSVIMSYSAQPTAIAHGAYGDRNCYATVRLDTDKSGKVHTVFRRIECPKPYEGLSDIGVPADGPLINMGGIREATHVRILKNGNIQLY